MIYFGKPPTASYSTFLGKVYKVARTEFGLRLTKRVLEQVKKVSPNLILEQEQVEEIIKSGDAVWEQCKKDEEDDSEELLEVSFYCLMDDLGIKLPDEAVVVPDVVDAWEPDDLPAYTHGTNELVQDEYQRQDIAPTTSNENIEEGKWL